MPDNGYVFTVIVAVMAFVPTVLAILGLIAYEEEE